MEGLPGVRSARAEAGRHRRSPSTELHVAMPAPCWSGSARGGWTLAGLTTRHASLEDVFVSLTGRQLRDE